MGKSLGMIALLAGIAYVAYRFWQSKNPSTAQAQNIAAAAALNTSATPSPSCCLINLGSGNGGSKVSPAVANKPGVSIYCCTASPNLPAQVRAYAKANPCQVAQPGFAPSLGPYENMPGCAPQCCNMILD